MLGSVIFQGKEKRKNVGKQSDSQAILHGDTRKRNERVVLYSARND